MIGTTLAHYRITAALGAGGMGEVWRAEDEKLGREVALKLLPADVAEDPDRLARFEREAKVLASLNHPNIATLFGLETIASKTETETETETGTDADADAGTGADGNSKFIIHNSKLTAPAVTFLVMELVEGEDLSERISRGPVPIDEAIPIALQIAEALEAAHESGIVHRDLKPANIKLTEDGTVKVLDFGLAKAWESDLGDSSLSLSPTMTQHATVEGVILGTAAYMSPEQARGKRVDRRADIWAFGVVFWEMLTGHKLFEGETVTDVLAALVRQEIDLGVLPQDLPDHILRLLERCLDRDPRARLRDIGEARIAITAPREADWRETEKAPTPRLGKPLIVAALVLAALAIGILMPWPRNKLESTPARSPRRMMLPVEGRVLYDSQAISPDGRWLAYTAGETLWIRPMDELEARKVPNSGGAQGPFWSPLSDEIAFAARGGLFKVRVEGGPPVELCRITGGGYTGGSWSAVEGIVFTLSRANWDGKVLRVDEDGGEPEVYAEADSEIGERRIHEPHFLPDGKSLLYSVVTRESNNSEIAIERDGSRSLLGLGNGSSQAVWSQTGHIVYTRNAGTDPELWAVAVSLDDRSIQGEPFRIVDGGTMPSIAGDGTLVYSLIRPDPQQLLRVDRSGEVLATIGGPIETTIWSPNFSPDGTKLAASLAWYEIDVWDLRRGVRTRVTGEGEWAVFPAWLPAGDEITYITFDAGESLVARRADGSGEARSLLRMDGAAGPSVSQDGAHIVFYVVDPLSGRDLWAVDTATPADPYIVLQTSANEALPQLSPDGKWVAYQSDASGQWEVYIQPFPEGGRWQVSVNGGEHPRWSAAAGELFFVAENHLMAVDIDTEPEVRIGSPAPLFGGDAVGTNLARRGMVESFYDVSPDGRSFAVVKGVEMGANRIVVAGGLIETAGDTE